MKTQGKKEIQLYKVQKIIEGKEVTYFYDEDKRAGILGGLSAAGKIEWFKGRMLKNYLNPIIEIFWKNTETSKLLRGKKKSKQINFMIAAFSVMLNGVDALGSFVRGERGSKKNFIAFIEKYLPAKWKSHKEMLYEQFRCGIAHGFLIENGGIRYGAGGKKGFLKTPSGQLFIDPWRFLIDLKRGIRKYFHDLRSHQDLMKKFIKRFGEIYK